MCLRQPLLLADVCEEIGIHLVKVAHGDALDPARRVEQRTVHARFVRCRMREKKEQPMFHAYADLIVG